MLRTALIGTGALALVGATGLISYNAGANNTAAITVAQPEMEMDMDEAMAMMMQAAAPGEHHAKLTANAGEWTSRSKFEMGPGQTSEGDGKLTVKPIIGERFTLGHYTGDFAGAPFEGISITGYDNVKKEYVSVWLDNFGTAILYMTGNWEGDALVLAGKTSTVMGDHEMKISSVQPNANSMTDTFYEMRDGEWAKSGQIVYTRGADHGESHDEKGGHDKDGHDHGG